MQLGGPSDVKIDEETCGRAFRRGQETRAEQMPNRGGPPPQQFLPTAVCTDCTLRTGITGGFAALQPRPPIRSNAARGCASGARQDAVSMDRPNHPRQRAHTLLLCCSCGLLVYLLHFDIPTDSTIPVTLPLGTVIPDPPATEASTEVEVTVDLIDVPIEPLVATSESEPPIRPEPQPDGELQSLLNELDSTKNQLATTSAELAAARQEADQAGTQVECLQSEISQFDSDLSFVTAAHIEAVKERVRYNQDAATRQTQAARSAADFEATQRQQLAQLYEQIDRDRKSREATRAKLGLPPENQDEGIRQRQRQRAALKQVEAELIAFRQQQSERSLSELTNLEARVQQADRLIQRISQRRETSLARLTTAQVTLADCRSRIESAQIQLTHLESHRTLLLSNARVKAHH